MKIFNMSMVLVLSFLLFTQWQQIEAISSTTGFEASISHLVNDVLNVDTMQNVLDDQVTFTSTAINGATVLTRLQNALTTKVNEHFQLVKDLQSTVQSTYAQFTSNAGHSECCHFSEGSEIDYQFKRSINKDQMCIRRSSYVAAESNVRYATSALLQRFKDNMASVPGVKYQYFGSDKGVLFSYPASRADDCDQYDPRFRPWYVETATPVPKDIVLVIDVSGSMRTQSGGQSRMHMAQEAAKAVITALNPSDRVGVVSFSTWGYGYDSEDSSCFRTQLALANPSNKRRFLEFVDGLIPDGSTYYSRGLDVAFDLFINADYSSSEFSGTRKKAILFLTDGEHSESWSTISDVITTQEARLNNAVTIMPYGIGSLSGTTRVNLQSMAETAQTYQTAPVFITDTRDLKRHMASFYTFFGDYTIVKPVIATPYFDAFGLGLITTVSLPVYSGSEFVGVVGIDISLGSLLEDISYFEQSSKTYAFVGNTNGVAMSHPMLPIPMNVDADPISVKLDLLEKYTSGTDIITSMNSGSAGTESSVTTTVLQPHGSGRVDGMVELNYTADYHWAQIQDNSSSADVISVAVKVETGATQSHGALTTPLASIPFMYHEHNLMSSPPTTCVHFLSRAILGESVVKFSPQAFIDPFAYLDTEETQQLVTMYQNIMAGTHADQVFKTGIVDTVEFSSQIQAYWFSEQPNLAIWRYVAFSNGVLRLSPGTELKKMYSPSERNWYKKAVSFPGTAVLSVPYLDAFGAGYVITLAHVLYEGIPLASSHASTEPVIGVMGMDFSVNYVYSLLIANFPHCEQSDNQCFIMDTGGHIVVHPDFVEVAGFENPLTGSLHVTVKEKAIADYLITNNYMTQKSCHNPTSIKEFYYYEIDISSVTYVDNLAGTTPFEMRLIPGTNTYIVKSTVGYTTPYCPCLNRTSSSSPCPTSVQACMCPCSDYIPSSYTPCTNQYTYASLADFHVCTPEGAHLDIDVSIDTDFGDDTRCFPVNCTTKSARNTCYQYPQCNWCTRDIEHELDEPFCADADFCYFGQIGYRSPYDVDSVLDLGDIFNLANLMKLASSIIGPFIFVFLLCMICCCLKNKKREPHNVPYPMHQAPHPQPQPDAPMNVTVNVGGGQPQPPPPGYPAQQMPSPGYQGYGAPHHQPYPPPSPQYVGGPPAPQYGPGYAPQPQY